MRAVIQRVTSASVSVDGEVISSISRGLVVLLGIGKGAANLGLKYDTTADAEHIVKKILALRVFEDDSGAMWRKSVKDITGDVLCVSQFTLLANTTKDKPDFHRAMGSAQAMDMYTNFLKRMGDMYHSDRIKDGMFGAMMNVSLVNDGPVTFTLDSRKFEYVQPSEKA